MLGAEKRMGADDDVDVALGEALLRGFEFLAGDEARGLAPAKGRPLKRSVKVA